ncbi:MAG: DUF7144 family membrane protein [Actinomycetota bacterium]
MEPLPPPPPPRPDMSWQADDRAPVSLPARPQLVTAAGVILIVLGVMQVLAGLVLIVVSPDDLASIASIGNLNLDRVARGIGLFSLVVGSLEVLAGIWVLRLSDKGRIFAIVLASIGLLGGIGSVSRGSVPGVVTLGLYAFVIYALFAHGAAFRGTRQG